MNIIIATLAIALISLLGMFFFGERGEIKSTHKFIVPFAIGTFLAITFFELIPQTLATAPFFGSVAIVGGFLLFYLVSNVLHTYHRQHVCKDSAATCEVTRVSALLLLWGDFVHNITDGVVLASAFLVNPAAGWVTALGIAMHEVPQEIADFGVLRSVGYSRTKAGVLNFASACGIFIGALLVVSFAAYFAEYVWMLLGVAAGNLLYVAASDLLPGVHRESHSSGTFVGAFVSTLLGVVLVGTLIGYSHLYLRDNPEEEDYLLEESTEIHNGTLYKIH